MYIQLTNYGVQVLETATSPVVFDRFKLGSDFGYIPSATQSDIQGIMVAEGVPSAPLIVNANIIKYGLYLDYDVGDYEFGECGWFHQGKLFAIGVRTSLLKKEKASGQSVGNSIRLDAYLQVTGNYSMWVDLAESSNNFRLARFRSVDDLPPAPGAVPNAYVITGATTDQSSFLAFTDQNALWSFDAYKFSTTYRNYVVKLASNFSVTLDLGQNPDPDLAANKFFGDRIVQFKDGTIPGTCRYVLNAVQQGTELTLTFASPLAKLPDVGDSFMVFHREPLSVSSLILPIATATRLGAITVGDGLDVTPGGHLSVDLMKYSGDVVRKVNGKTGDVTLTAADIPGAVRSVNGVMPNASGNVVVPTGSNPGIASTTVLGLVKLPSGPDPTIVANAQGVLGLGFTPVRDVNGKSGNVKLFGFVDPTALTSSSTVDTLLAEGKYYTADSSTVTGAPQGATGAGMLLVSNLSADSSGTTALQTWTTTTQIFARSVGAVNTQWSNVGVTAGIASASALGLIRLGTTLAANPLTGITNVVDATTTAKGAVQIGQGLKVMGGVVSSAILTVGGASPDNTGNIVVNVANLGAIPITWIGRQGGVPGPQGEDPLGAPDADDRIASDFEYNRFPATQLPKSAVVFAGTWNATTNASTDLGTYLDDTHYTTAKLLAGGQIEISYTEMGNARTLTGSGRGMLFRVAVAGGTALDGTAQWAEDEFVLGVDGKWLSLSSGGGGGGPTTVVAVTTLPTTFAPNTIYLYTGTAPATLNVNNVTGDSITIIAREYPVTCTGNVLPSSSGGPNIVGGGIASLIKLPDGTYYLYGDTAT